MNKISGISLEDLGNVGSFEDEFKPMEIEELTDITKSPAKEELLRRMDKYCASFEYRFDEKAMNVKIASIIILLLTIIISRYFSNNRADVTVSGSFLAILSFFGLYCLHTRHVSGIGVFVVLYAFWIVSVFAYSISEIIPVDQSRISNVARELCSVPSINADIGNCFSTLKNRLLFVNLSTTIIIAMALAFHWRLTKNIYNFAQEYSINN